MTRILTLTILVACVIMTACGPAEIKPSVVTVFTAATDKKIENIEDELYDANASMRGLDPCMDYARFLKIKSVQKEYEAMNVSDSLGNLIYDELKIAAEDTAATTYKELRSGRHLQVCDDIEKSVFIIEISKMIDGYTDLLLQQFPHRILRDEYVWAVRSAIRAAVAEYRKQPDSANISKLADLTSGGNHTFGVTGKEFGLPDDLSKRLGL